MLTDNTDNNEISKMLQFVPQVGDIFDVKDKVGEGKYFKYIYVGFIAIYRHIFSHSTKLR